MTVAKGLEGVIALESAISTIIDSTLIYRGISIDELADNATYEEVVYLLWYGHLPTARALEEFQQQLAANRTVPAPVLDFLRTQPAQADTMDVLRTAVSLLALYDPETADMSTEANLRKGMRLVGQFPTIVAAMGRLRQGLEPLAPRSDLTAAANFLYMLHGREPDPLAIRAFDEALVLHADHELNASTFALRVAASTLADLHTAVVAALAALKGPLHGGANERVMEMLERIGDVSRAEAYIREALARRERIMGFGHRVYKHGDPRARHLRELSRLLADRSGDRRWYEISVRIEELMLQLKNLYPNVDFYAASVYRYLGIPTELFTPIFSCSRVAGWVAHTLEQYQDNRLIRPRAEYTGPLGLHYVPLDQRG